MKHLLLLLLLFASPAMSQVIATTGEHGPFTRLVLQFPGAPDWRFGRTEGGYELAVAGASPTYDLSNAFRLIDRQRLKAIWADPETGNLQLGLACTCHARVDTIGTNILVVDIHDGPPIDLGYEASLDGLALGPILEPGRISPKPRPRTETNETYDWTSAQTTAEQAGSVSQQDGPLASQYALQEFRRRLTLQLASTGANGFVTLADEHNLLQPVEGARTGSNFHIGPPDVLTQGGQTCLEDGDLGLATWASGTNPAQELATARASILGEFDAISQKDLQSAVRIHLFYGFGAEARSLMRAFGYQGPDNTLLDALASLVDGEPLDINPFESQHTCSGYAALWAMAAQDEEAPVLAVNADGIVQTFLALPKHLQVILAADLGRKLVAAGHPQSAEVMVNAVKRASGKIDVQAHLIAAEVAIKRDDHSRARTELEAIEPSRDTHRTLIARAETAFRDGKPPRPDFVTEMDALYFSQGTGPHARQITRAQALTKAMSGSFDAALSLPDLEPDTLRDVWSYLATAGSDAALLAASSTISAKDRKLLAPPVIESVVKRLIGLGVPKLAEDWMAAVSVSDELKVRLALERRDGRGALLGLESASFAEAGDLRSLAFTQLGEFGASAEILETVGKQEEAIRHLRWANDWAALSSGDADPWSRLARTASVKAQPSDPLTLAQTEEILAQTNQQINDIETLLGGTQRLEPIQ